MEEPSGLSSLDKPLVATDLKEMVLMKTSPQSSLETLDSEPSNGPLRNSSSQLVLSRKSELLLEKMRDQEDSLMLNLRLMLKHKLLWPLPDKNLTEELLDLISLPLEAEAAVAEEETEEAEVVVEAEASVVVEAEASVIEEEEVVVEASVIEEEEVVVEASVIEEVEVVVIEEDSLSQEWPSVKETPLCCDQLGE
jgi:hypothetical protein